MSEKTTKNDKYELVKEYLGNYLLYKNMLLFVKNRQNSMLIFEIFNEQCDYPADIRKYF